MQPPSYTFIISIGIWYCTRYKWVHDVRRAQTMITISPSICHSIKEKELLPVTYGRHGAGDSFSVLVTFRRKYK